MQITLILATLLASAVSARQFSLCDQVNFGPPCYGENRNNDAACWNLNGKGDKTSSVDGGAGCTTFFRERDCQGSNWQQRGRAFTVPAHMEDHFWSFRNQC